MSYLRNKRTLLLLLLGVMMANAIAQVPFQPVDEKRVGEIVPMLSQKPFGMGTTYKEREPFNRMKQDIDWASLKGKADSIVATPMPAWSDSLYLIFSKNGERVEGQQMIARRIGRLYPLMWAECIENKGRYIETIESTLTQIITHRSWVYPAHDRELNAFHGRTREVDLLAANWAHNLAQSLYMLDDKISPKVRNAVIDSLWSRVFTPVLEASVTPQGRTFRWMNSTGNWNAVCLSGVLGAALTLIDDIQMRARFVAIAEYYIQNSYLGYTDDGYCTEGIGYYNYGFGHFITLREKLFTATGGKIDLFQHPKAKNMVLYGVNLEIMNGVFPAFADCHFNTTVSPAVMWYTNRALQLGLKRYEALAPLSAPEFFQSFYIYFPNTSMSGTIQPPAGKEEKATLRHYFNDAGILICRPTNPTVKSMGAALKGGTNGDHHNHNDVGSYSLVVGDETLSGDVGGPTLYNGKMFQTVTRYTLYKRPGSYGHPVPLVDGVQQSVGKQYCAKVLKTDFTDQQDLFSLDILGAYPELKTVKKLHRNFTFGRKGSGSLSVRDEFTFMDKGTMEVPLTFFGSWTKLPNGMVKIQGKKSALLVKITIPKGTSYTLTDEVISEYGTPFTRLSVKLNEQVKEGFLEIHYTVE